MMQIAGNSRLGALRSTRTNPGPPGLALWAGLCKVFSLPVLTDLTLMPAKDLLMAKFWLLETISAW